MICKYCGKPVTGGICTSCRKAVLLSYTSHELSDMLGPNVVPSPPPPIGQEQLHAAYEEGFSSGKKHGYSIGWDAAQKDAFEKSMHKQRLLMIIAASAMVFLAVICSFAFNSIGFSRGYQKGKIEGKQEQKTDDETIISETLNSERQDGYDEGYRAGYEEGKSAGYQLGFDEGILMTPSPSSTPSPTPSPIVLKMKSKGSEVRKLQQRLIELGYLDQNEDDGDYGPKTKKAIEEFQKKNGVTPVDGSTVRQDVWDLIMSENAIPMIPISTPTAEVYSENPNSTPENESAPTEVSNTTLSTPETQENSEEPIENEYEENNETLLDESLPSISYSINIAGENVMNYRAHSLEEAESLPTEQPSRSLGRKWVYYDRSLGKTRMYIQLDNEAYWYLSIFFNESGQIDMYSLDYEGASDSHYEFKDEMAVRRALGAEHQNDRFLDEIMTQYILNHSIWSMLDAIKPYITAQYHFD